jgi:hypothetical protein
MLSGLLQWYSKFILFAACKKLPSHLGIEKLQLVERTFNLESEAMNIPKRLFMASELLRQLVFCESFLVMWRLLYPLT